MVVSPKSTSCLHFLKQKPGILCILELNSESLHRIHAVNIIHGVKKYSNNKQPALIVFLTCKLQPQVDLTDSFANDLSQENLNLVLAKHREIVQRSWLSLKSMDTE